jgi:hypothetical protein
MAILLLDRRNVVIGLALVAVIFVCGILLGYFTHDKIPAVNSDQFKSEQELVKTALNNVDSDKLRSYLEKLTKEPHIAGQRRDNELIEWIRQSWLDEGLDKVEKAEYEFYLTWPNKVLHN